MKKIERRTFVKSGATAVAAAALPCQVLPAQEVATPQATVVVVHGTDIPKMVEAGIAKLGGWDKFFKSGMKVVLKPNVAWNSTPEQGGNTHPELVKVCVDKAKELGASKITLPENTCHPEKATFKASGIEDILAGTGARLYRPKGDDFKEVKIPQGKTAKTAKIPQEIVECDCLINMPVAKHHGGATLTLSMKNWMGSIANENRREWHRDGLHQCIADFSTFIKPHLIIIDATRIMLNKGPQGPGDLDHPNELIFSTDPVAADAYATTLFKRKPFDVEYVKLAHEAGVGCGDLAQIKIERVEV